jgi:hypothetical protein
VLGTDYPKKAILLLHIAKEANFHNVETVTVQSCGKHVYADGRNLANFKVRARFSLNKGTVKEYDSGTGPAVSTLPAMGGGDGENFDDDENGRRRRTRTQRTKKMVKETGIFLVMRAIVMVCPSPRKGTREKNAGHPSRASGSCPSSKSILQSNLPCLTRSTHICCACMHVKIS